MADNSIREQLLVVTQNLIEAAGIFNAVKRIRLSHSQLSEFASTQFPVAAIVGGLPVPVPHEATRGIPKDVFIMDLQVQLFVYLLAREDFDTEISSMADDVWRILQTDQSRDNLSFETLVTPAAPVHMFAPYAGFSFLINYKYQTDTGGI